MSVENSQDQPIETPLERAARLENEPRQQQETAVLLQDIDQYVAETDPEHLPEAEAELANWKAPEDPLSHGVNAPAGDTTPVVAVFSAYNEMEANIVKSVLDAAGIPSSFDNLGGTVMGGIFSAGEQVWADIVVPEPYVEDAKRAIAESTFESGGSTTTAGSLSEDDVFETPAAVSDVNIR